MDDAISILSEVEESSFDLVIAMDIIPYFGGSLPKLFAGVYTVLVKGGVFLLNADSLQEIDNNSSFEFVETFVMSKSGRYLHNQRYDCEIIFHEIS